MTIAPTQLAFPAGAIEACIRGALDAKAGTQATLLGLPQIPPVGGWEPSIDSLTVVLIICEVEEMLGVSLPSDFIPRGGYNSEDDCVQDLVAQAKTVWMANAKLVPAYV